MCKMCHKYSRNFSLKKTWKNQSFFPQDQIHSLPTPLLWLAASADRRVSIWSADWSKDFCELVDWLTFPAPPIGPDGKAIRRGDLVRE